jgi:hypothetical protein
MKAHVTLEMTDGNVHQVTITPPDFIRWEKTYKSRTSELAASWKMEDWMYLAWCALKRGGEAGDKFDDWQLEVAEVRLEDDAPRPT